VNDEILKAKVVHLILDRRPEDALELLCRRYRVEKPKLRVGLPKGHRKSLGCYVTKKKTIYVSDKESLYNPYVILHEFYHHLRTINGRHKGTEKYANRFAEEYIEAYRKVCKRIFKSSYKKDTD